MITTLTGSNQFLLKNESKKLVNQFIRQYTDMGLERLDGEELSVDTLRGAVESLPFLVERKMVVVRNAANNKDITEHIEDLLGAVADTTDLVIVEHKLDKRSVYYKTLRKLTDFKEFNELDEGGLARWLVAEAKSREGNLSLADANYLVQRIGLNQLMLESELTKLLIYDLRISRETIDLLTEPTPQSTIFELLDAAFAGNAKKALAMYDDQRQQKVEPLAILAMLAWQLHVLAVVKVAGKRTADEIVREAKLSPFVVRKSQGIARKLSLEKLRELISRALAMDLRLKSEAADADETLKHYLMVLARD